MVRFLWPTLLAGAVIVAAVVSAAGEETRIELEYLDQMRDQATELSRSGASIRQMMSRISDVDRAEFTTVFDSVLIDLDVALAFVADEPPVESLIPVWALYRQTVQTWDDGANRLSESILRAADEPDDVTVVNEVADALADLRAGDNLFRDLKAEFERAEIPDPVSPLVDVRMMPSDSGLISLSVSYVAAARLSTNSLGLRPALGVSQVVTDPSWQVSVEGQAVVPATESIVVSTVITNSGNVASQPETVNMTLNGGAEPVFAQAEVPALQPDGQTTIEFPPVEVVPDTLYEIEIELILSNPDSDLTDNDLRVQFTVNPG